MSRKYKFNNPSGIYFLSFATVGWVDIFSRKMYKDIFVESLGYCQKEKGKALYGWCMENIESTSGTLPLEKRTIRFSCKQGLA